MRIAAAVPLTLLLTLLVLSATGRADESKARVQHDARLLSASPDAPVFSIGWRDAVRTRLSVPIPMFGARDKPAGLLLRLVPLVELQNGHGSDQPIPHEQWRGRLAIVGGWRLQHRLRQPDDATLTVWLGVEHESDHQTRPYVSRDRFGKVLNDVLLRGDWTTSLGNVGLTTSLVERVHFLTCTEVDIECAGGDEGSPSLETARIRRRTAANMTPSVSMALPLAWTNRSNLT